MNPTVLVVDDEPTICEMLDYNLRREGYRVLTAADGPTALRVVYAERPDLLILDLMLPGLTGFEVCRLVRRDFQMPILILSAREDEIDKVLGLELGADDYLTKPFGLHELVARVHALLRRAPWRPPVPPPDVPGGGTGGRTLISVGDLQIDLAQRSVRRAGAVLVLKPKEFDLLVFLAAHTQQVFSRAALLDAVWGADYVGGDRTVDVHIHELRSKIEADPVAPAILETVYGVGYKFTIPVTRRVSPTGR